MLNKMLNRNKIKTIIRSKKEKPGLAKSFGFSFFYICFRLYLLKIVQGLAVCR